MLFYGMKRRTKILFITYLWAMVGLLIYLGGGDRIEKAATPTKAPGNKTTQEGSSHYDRSGENNKRTATGSPGKVTRNLAGEAGTGKPAGGRTRDNEVIRYAPGSGPGISRPANGEIVHNRPSSRGGYRKYSLVNLGTFEITGYCPCEKCTDKKPSDPGYGKTATETEALEGRTVAADWLHLPPGSVIQIDGLPSTYTVEDRGGAVNGQELDLFFNKHQDALNWGRKYKRVWLVGGP